MTSYIDTIDKNIIENLLIDENYNDLTDLYKEKIIELQENINKKYPLMNYSILFVLIYEQMEDYEKTNISERPTEIHEYTLKYNDEYIMKIKIYELDDYKWIIEIWWEQYIKNLTYIDYTINKGYYKTYYGFDFLYNVVWFPTHDIELNQEFMEELEENRFKNEFLHILNPLNDLFLYFKKNMVKEFEYNYHNPIESIEDTETILDMVNELKKYNQMNYLDEVFKNASETLKNNRELVLSLVKLNGKTLKYASDTLKNDKEIVWDTLKNDLSAFEYISEDLKKDRKIVLFSVKREGVLFQYLCETMRNDREIALLSMKTHGLSLEFASETFKNDYEIVLSAVQQCGYALVYASDEMKNNKSIVLAAVKNEPFSLNDASDIIKAELQNT